MFEDIAALVAGYLFSLLVGYWALSQLMDTLWRRVLAPVSATRRLPPNHYPEHPQAVGLLERALYTASWQLGVREFIGIWLLLKLAGGWHDWREGLLVGAGKIPGRTLFHVFLIGTGVSLAFGVSGALITEWLQRDTWVLALLLGVALLGSTLALRWFLGRPHASLNAPREG